MRQVEPYRFNQKVKFYNTGNQSFGSDTLFLYRL